MIEHLAQRKMMKYSRKGVDDFVFCFGSPGCVLLVVLCCVWGCVWCPGCVQVIGSVVFVVVVFSVVLTWMASQGMESRLL